MALTDHDHVIVGVFPDLARAERAVDDLHRAGFPKDEIGFAAKGEGTGGGGLLTPGDTKAAEGAVVGALGGGVIGGILGALLTGLIPGIGPLVAAGALGAVLLGAGGGAITTGLAGAIAGLGIADKDARFYEQEFKEGRPLVMVRPGDRAAEAAEILTRDGAYFAPRHPIPETAENSGDVQIETGS